MIVRHLDDSYRVGDTLLISAPDALIISAAEDICARYGMTLPRVSVPVMSIIRDGPDTAEVDFQSRPPKVRRFNRIPPTLREYL